MAAMSPMMQQYIKIKEQHKDQILFFRLGDFYEMFFEDAKIASRELELTLTGKVCGLEERAPMCGVPYHSSEIYIKRLIDKGYKVAICEQTEDPAKAKGLVSREVIRVVTPGTVIENSMLDETRNNYIASVFVQKNGFAICFADVSTGDVFISAIETRDIDQAVINELSRFSPVEILFNKEFLSLKGSGKFIKEKLHCVTELYEDEKCKEEFAKEILKRHFEEDPKQLQQLEGSAQSVIALGILIDYLNETQKHGVKRIIHINTYHDDQYMVLDMNARRNLELTETMRTKEKRGSLLWVLDHTKTAMGRRLMRKLIEQPLVNIAMITKRQNAVGELYGNAILRDQLTSLLSDVYDLERLMTKVIFGNAGPRDLKSLSFSAKSLPQIKQLLCDCKATLLEELYEQIDPMQEIESVVDQAIVDQPPVSLKDGGVICKGFNAELDELREIHSNAKKYISKIEEKEKEATGIKNLKVGYNRVFGYYIEVTKSNIDLVPEHYVRKQTLTNCERYISQELKELENKVLSASDKIIALEQEMYDQVCSFVAKKLTEVQETASALAMLDVLCSLASVAADNHYVCPQFTTQDVIDIKEGRHPVVELMSSGVFVPNDVYFDKTDHRLLMITGPNMAGKSTYMRQCALIILMAQIGSFVPAKSATLCIVDKIFTRVGASDDLASGQSTFMVEMSEVADILKNATPRSFVILDEIGRGTSTFDGMSIARAVVEHILKAKPSGAKTMFATHYHELTSLEQTLTGVKNYNIAVKKRGDDIIFLRKIVPGSADDSYGIEVAKLAGVPNSVVHRAKEVLVELESGTMPSYQTERVAEPVNSFESQLSFTGAAEHDVVEELKKITVETLTPIEALNKLYDLKKLLN